MACDANNLTFKYLGNLWGTAHVYIDVPYEVSRDSAVYVAGQLRELCGTTQELYGCVLDEGKLREQVARSQRTLRNLASSLEMRRGRDLRSTMANEMQQMIAMHLSLGLPRTELMTEQLLSGLPGAQGYGGVSLVWGHSMPFLIEPIHQMLDCNPRAQVVVNEMLCDQILPKGEDFWFGPDQPYEAMAERLVRNSYNGPASAQARAVAPAVRGHRRGRCGDICPLGLQGDVRCHPALAQGA